MEICGYMFTCGIDEQFLTADDAARVIMEPREIYSCYGNKCERLDRDARGRLVEYSAIFWCGHDTKVLNIRACYRAELSDKMDKIREKLRAVRVRHLEKLSSER